MKSIVIGAGEIGKALYNILRKEHETYIRDITNDDVVPTVDIIHICFPYSDKFIEQVKEYQKVYNAKYTVIHSTVRPGTSRELGAIHSPVVGIHPHLEQSLKTFTKFIAGEQATEIADYFRKAGLHVYLFDKQETTEMMKILDTTLYGLCVEYTKDVKRLAEENGIPFEAWTIWNQSYNIGYQALGYPEYTRPNLVPVMKKIGGHCILPNTQLLETKFTKFLRELNEE